VLPCQLFGSLDGHCFTIGECALKRFVPSDVTLADTQRGLQLLDMATQDAKVIAINVKMWPTRVIGWGSHCASLLQVASRSCESHPSDCHRLAGGAGPTLSPPNTQRAAARLLVCRHDVTYGRHCPTCAAHCMFYLPALQSGQRLALSSGSTPDPAVYGPTRALYVQGAHSGHRGPQSIHAPHLRYLLCAESSRSPVWASMRMACHTPAAPCIHLHCTGVASSNRLGRILLWMALHSHSTVLSPGVQL
jgi:hypothetical protein